MTGLVIKDLLVLRRTVKIYIGMLVFYLVLTLAGAFDNSLLTGFVTLFTLMLPISSFSYDELARWDKYAAALPIGRRGIVGAKYLLTILLGALAQGLVAVMTAILAVLGKAEPVEMLLTGLGCVGVGLLMNSILLPLLFKFGAEKGRLFTMGIFAALFLVGFGGAKLLSGTVSLGALLRPGTVLALLAAAVVLLALYVSYHVSLSIYQKKEL